MASIYLSDIVSSLQNTNYIWLIIPIFFIGVITDKYQEEFGTSVGNAISNGALVIFTGFSWIQMISSRVSFPIDVTISQYIFSIILIVYGMAIMISGFTDSNFARKYGRIRVITFMLMFFTMMLYIPILYNFVSIIMFVFLFPFYYAFISELIRIMPNVKKSKIGQREDITSKNFKKIFRKRIKEYLE